MTAPSSPPSLSAPPPPAMRSRPASPTPTPTAGPRGARIVAKSVFRELKSAGYGCDDILAFANELLSFVSADLRGEPGVKLPGDAD